MTIRCVVFDIDDTLYLERDYVRSGFQAAGVIAARRFGIRNFADLAWQAFCNGSRGHIFDEVLAQVDVVADIADLDALVLEYRTHTPNISLLPDAREAMMFSSAHGAVAVVTDGPLMSQDAK